MKKPSGWTNLQDYLGVNQDQGQEMAGRVAGQVNQFAGAAQGALQADQNKLSQSTHAANRDLGATPTTSADAAARAASAKYSGPESLDAIDPNLNAKIGDAARRVQQAGTGAGQSELLGQTYANGGGGTTGGKSLDSFLLSGAGGGAAMQGIQDQYGHLGQDYDAAKMAGDKTVAGAKRDAQANVDKWGALQQKLLGDETGAAAASKKAADDAAFEKRWQGAQQANAGDELNRAFGAFNTVMSPSAQIAQHSGNADFTQAYGTKLLSPQGGAASGGSNGQKIWWKPQHKEVYRQMDPKQWAELNSMGGAAQSKWLDTRAAELKSGKPHAYFDAGKAFDADPFYGL